MRARRLITVVGCHAGGEIGNVVVGGVLPPPGATVFEQMQALRRDDDSLRRLLLREPRGSVAVPRQPHRPGDAPGLRRRLHHHGADRVSGDVGLEHDLRRDRAARDRDGRDARAGDDRPAGGAGRRRRGTARLPRRTLRERRAARTSPASPTGSTRRSRSRGSARSRSMSPSAACGTRSPTRGARLRDRAGRGARALARRRADPGGGARAAAVRASREPRDRGREHRPDRGAVAGRRRGDEERRRRRAGPARPLGHRDGPVGADGRAPRARADAASATR